MNLEHFQLNDWINIWTGQWSFLTCSYWGERYTQGYLINGQTFLKKTVFLFENGKSSCFGPQSEREAFGLNLADEFIHSPQRAGQIIANFRQCTDDILSFFETHEHDEITPQLYTEYWHLQDAYYPPHINTKFVTDYLPKDLLESLLPTLESARLHAEPVFRKTEEFMQKLAKQIADEVKIPSQFILCLTRQELEAYFESQPLPKLSILEQRYERSAQLFEQGEGQILVGDQTSLIKDVIYSEPATIDLKGMTAYPGKVTGTVKIVLDPAKATDFQPGDILVTGMTRPEYLALMRQAAAFITDAGGVLSHAAIVARELKKPCVIGVKIATKALKNGDRVEIDAAAGTIKIIK